MNRIFQYELTPNTNSILMPKGAKILCVHLKDKKPCLWAIVDDTAPTELRKVTIMTTGEGFPPDIKRRYLGTFQIHHDGNVTFVFHVFEEV